MNKEQADSATALILALQRKCEYQAEQLNSQAGQLEIARDYIGIHRICANCERFIPKYPKDASPKDATDDYYAFDRHLCSMSCLHCYDRYIANPQSIAPRISYCKNCVRHCLKSICPHRWVCNEHEHAHLEERCGRCRGRGCHCYDCFDCTSTKNITRE